MANMNQGQEVLWDAGQEAISAVSATAEIEGDAGDVELGCKGEKKKKKKGFEAGEAGETEGEAGEVGCGCGCGTKEKKGELEKGNIHSLQLGKTERIGNIQINEDKATFRKKLIEAGTWIDPLNDKETLEITQERMEGWVDNFEAGCVKVAVPLRHSQYPLDNTGWMTGLEIDGDALYGTLEISHTETIEAIKAGTIQDVSLGINLNYIDGHGKKLGEVIEHVALTLTPYIKEQGDNDDGKFEALEKERTYIYMERGATEVKLEGGMNTGDWTLTDMEIAVLPDTAFASVYTDCNYINGQEIKTVKRLYPHHNAAGQAVLGAVTAGITEIINQITKNDCCCRSREGLEHLTAHYQDFGKPPITIALSIEDAVSKLVELEKKAEGNDQEGETLEAENQRKEEEAMTEKVIELEKRVKELEACEAKVKELEAYKETKEQEEVTRKVTVLLEAGQITPAVKDRVMALALQSIKTTLKLEKGERRVSDEMLEILAELPKKVASGEMTGVVLERPGEVDAAKEAARLLENFGKK